MDKVTTDYSHKTIPQTNTIYVRISKNFASQGMGIIGNSYITYTGTKAADCLSAGSIWETAKNKAEGGNEMDILDAETKFIEFHRHLKIIALDTNILLTGNELGLTSTGLPLALPGEEVGEMDKPLITSIDPVDGVTGFADAKIKTSQKTCYGTHIEVKNLVTGVVVYSHSKRKHSLRIGGFVHGVDYEVRVAYDGTDETKVWSDWKDFLGK